MKKRFALLIFAALILCLCLTSCLVQNGPDYEKNGITDIIKPNVDTGFDFIGLRNAYHTSAGVMLNVRYESDKTESAGELCIGDTARAVTALAKSSFEAKLRSEGKEGDSDAIGYIIYSDGESVALWWSDAYVIEKAYTAFLNSYASKGTLTFDEGIIEISVISKRAEKLAAEEKQIEADFAKAEAVIGKEATDALRAHYSIYGDEIYKWIASLYDPGVGGFYYSDSALATEGYLPDLESTAQALGLLANIGIFADYGNSYAKGVPDWMKQQIVGFARGLQSSTDGYFYHPQWVNVSLSASRMGRDLDWATQLLKNFGSKPKWNTPNGFVGEYGAPSGAVAFTSGLSSVSAAVAASRAVAAAESTVYPARLKTVDAWRNYLICELNGNSDVSDTEANAFRYNSYSLGNTLTAQADQIIARDKAALSAGELTDGDKNGYGDGGYVETLIELLNGWQLPYNGLWEHNLSLDNGGNTVADEEGEPYYDSINGLMKISSVYVEMGVEFPNADAALEQAIYMINYYGDASDGKPEADIKGRRPVYVVDVYNPWIAAYQILSNIEMCGGAEHARALRSELNSNAAKMIRTTTAKTLLFKRDNGSFSYDWDGDMYTSQGAPAAVKGSCEGNVNGCTLAVTGVTRNICYTLGIENIPMFHSSDYDVLIELLEEASPVVKAPIIPEDPEPVGFEDYEVGARNDEIEELTYLLNTGYIEIVDAPKDASGEQGRALKLEALEEGANDAIYFAARGSGSSCFALEFDVYFEKYNIDTTLLNVTMSATYRLTFTSKDGYIYLGDTNNVSTAPINRDLGVAFAAGEWHSVRIEYYPADAADVRTKIFLDGKLRAVSDNYLGRNDTADTPVAPKATCTQATVNSLNPVIQTVYFDNVLLEKTGDIYVEQAVENPYRIKDFETPDSLFAANIGQAQVVTDPEGEQGRVLSFSSATVATIPSGTADADYNCFYLGLKMYAESEVGEIARILFDNGTAERAVVGWSLQVYREGARSYLAVYELTSSGVGEIPIVEGLPTEEWVELGFEYYRRQYDEEYTLCRSIIRGSDGEAIGYGESYYDVNNMKRDYSVARITSMGVADFRIDDLVPEKILKQYVDEDGKVLADSELPLPSAGAGSSTEAGRNHTGIFDFDSYQNGVPAVPGLVTSPYQEHYKNKIEIADDPTGTDGDKALMVNTAASNAGNTVNFAWSKTETSGDLYIVEYSIYVDSVAASGAVLQTSIRSSGSQDTTVFAFNMSVASDGDGGFKLRFGEKPESSADREILTVSGVSGWVDIKVVYDRSTHAATITVNGAEGQSTDAYWNEANKDLPAGFLYIFATRDSEICYYLDDVAVKNTEN